MTSSFQLAGIKLQLSKTAEFLSNIIPYMKNENCELKIAADWKEVA